MSKKKQIEFNIFSKVVQKNVSKNIQNFQKKIFFSSFKCFNKYSKFSKKKYFCLPLNVSKNIQNFQKKIFFSSFKCFKKYSKFSKKNIFFIL